MKPLLSREAARYRGTAVTACKMYRVLSKHHLLFPWSLSFPLCNCLSADSWQAPYSVLFEWHHVCVDPQACEWIQVVLPRCSLPSLQLPPHPYEPYYFLRHTPIMSSTPSSNSGSRVTPSTDSPIPSLESDTLPTETPQTQHHQTDDFIAQEMADYFVGIGVNAEAGSLKPRLQQV